MTNTHTALLQRKPVPSDLTVAICTIGRDGYLQAAIKSLLLTTPADVRLHIVLNAPEDPTLVTALEPLLDQWQGPVEQTVLNERLTISGSHNTALEQAKTEFITFMGDDDLALEPRVEQLLELFWTTTPTPAVVGSFCRRVSGSSENPRFSTNKDYGPSSVEEWKVQRDGDGLIELVFPSAIYRTELLRSIGGFEERFGSAMDLATFTILGQDHPVVADPRRTFAHRIHDGSVTSSSARQHSLRLRYTSECVAALRAGRDQPDWDLFVAEGQQASTVVRLAEERRTLSATLFRQGGAALASGQLAGIGKVAASALLSPATFLKRSRSQVAMETSSERVVSLIVDERTPGEANFYSDLRLELRRRGIELRVVVSSSNEGKSSAGVLSLPWADVRSPWTLRVGDRTLTGQLGLDVASSSDLLIIEYGVTQFLNSLVSLGHRILRARHAIWMTERSENDFSDANPLSSGLAQRTHWFFARSERAMGAAINTGLTSERITMLTNADSRITDFADGIVAALAAPARR